MTSDGNSDGLTFEQLRSANEARCHDSFHPVDIWDGLHWGAATAAHVGKAIGAQKELWRQQYPHYSGDVASSTALQATLSSQTELEKQIAHAVIYADLWAARNGINLGDAVRRAFNNKSAEIGSIFLI